MTVAITDIRNDIGELYASMDNGTTAVTSILTRAKNFVKLSTGTTVGYDEIVRPLCSAMCCNHILGGIDPVNKTIGSLSVGNKDIRTMQKYFMDEAKKAFIIKGYSLDGLSIIMMDSEDA